MTLLDLWLPILLSAVFVFIVSSVVHMLLPIHKNDAKKMPGEVDILAAIRDKGVTPGQYMFPCAASMADMGTPEMLEKFKLGPVGFITIVPSFNIGKSLWQWFIYSLVIGTAVAYISVMQLGGGVPAGGDVFWFTTTVGILAYALSYVHDSIWKGVSWGISMKFILDGVITAARRRISRGTPMRACSTPGCR